MTLQQPSTDVRRHRTPPINTPRLRLKPKALQCGYVDGAWWPRSDDLNKELPDLLAVLSVRLGRIDRVIYHLDEWATAPAKLDAAGGMPPSTPEWQTHRMGISAEAEYGDLQNQAK